MAGLKRPCCGLTWACSGWWSGSEFGAAMHHGLAPVGGALNDYACGGSAAMSVWLARPEVVKVTHPFDHC